MDMSSVVVDSFTKPIAAGVIGGLIIGPGKPIVGSRWITLGVEDSWTRWNRGILRRLQSQARRSLNRSVYTDGGLDGGLGLVSTDDEPMDDRYTGI